MNARRGDGKTWRVALIASIVLHTGLVAGLHFLPQRSSSAEGSPYVLAEVSDGNSENSGESGGTAQFIPYVPPESQGGPRSGKADLSPWPASPWPATPTLDPGVSSRAKSGSSGDASAAGAGVKSGPGPSMAKGTTTFFQVPTEGRRIVYVVDASMSMGKDGALRAAGNELVASIKRLPSSARFQVIVYNTRPHFLMPKWEKLLEPSPGVISAVAQAVAALTAEGGTNHGPALEQALALSPDVVYFLTDADDLTQDHLRLARRLNHAHAVIHTIELSTLHRHRPGMPLQLLASEHKGQYRAIDLRGP